MNKCTKFERKILKRCEDMLRCVTYNFIVITFKLQNWEILLDTVPINYIDNIMIIWNQKQLKRYGMTGEV